MKEACKEFRALREMKVFVDYLAPLDCQDYRDSRDHQEQRESLEKWVIRELSAPLAQLVPQAPPVLLEFQEGLVYQVLKESKACGVRRG